MRCLLINETLVRNQLSTTNVKCKCLIIEDSASGRTNLEKIFKALLKTFGIYEQRCVETISERLVVFETQLHHLNVLIIAKFRNPQV